MLILPPTLTKSNGGRHHWLHSPLTFARPKGLCLKLYSLSCVTTQPALGFNLEIFHPHTPADDSASPLTPKLYFHCPCNEDFETWVCSVKWGFLRSNYSCMCITPPPYFALGLFLIPRNMIQLYCYRYSPERPLYKVDIPGHRIAGFLRQSWFLITKYSWIFLPLNSLTMNSWFFCSPFLATYHRFCIPQEAHSIWLCTEDKNIHPV